MVNIRQNVTLAPFTTFNIGGPAKFFCQTDNEEDLMKAVRYARDNRLDIFILAGGSNILINDNGFNGLVIRIANTDCRVEGSQIHCGAGLALSQLLKVSSAHSLTGLEWASGIPGTVGGAVRGNAGAYGGEIKDNIASVRVFDIADFSIRSYNPTACHFSYRTSLFKDDPKLIILAAVFKLLRGDQEKIDSKMKEIISKRDKKLPQDCSAGSFFKNPVVTDQDLIKRFELDAGCPCRGGKIPAGWLIDELGLRGKKIGGVMISNKHANFVVNTGSGKAQDVVILASLIKQQVRNKLGVQLQEEIQYVGF